MRFAKLSRLIGWPLRPAKMYPPIGQSSEFQRSSRIPRNSSVTVTKRMLRCVLGSPSSRCQIERRTWICCSVRSHSSHRSPRASPANAGKGHDANRGTRYRFALQGGEDRLHLFPGGSDGRLWLCGRLFVPFLFSAMKKRILGLVWPAFVNPLENQFGVTDGCPKGRTLAPGMAWWGVSKARETHRTAH